VKTCNDCYFYNAWEGYCCHKKHAKCPHYGMDKACEEFVQDPIAAEIDGEDDD